MKKLIFLASLPLFALAATPAANADYDIIPRAVNFVLFVAILLYFVANPAKEFYKARIAKISSRLEDIQRKVLESKNKKLEVMKKLEEAKKTSQLAINSAKKEAQLLAEKVQEDTKQSLELLEKQNLEQQEYELRKMQKEVVSSVLTQLFDSDKTRLSQDDTLKIILKKVS